MVRSALRTCFFFDEYRPVSPNFPGSPFGAVMRAAFGTESDDLNRDSGDEFVEPVQNMVQALGDGEGYAHVASPQHRARMSGFLRNREECDRVVRQVRPTDIERKEQQRCMDDLKKSLRPQELHWTGSVGNRTALTDAHDLDVCVQLGAGIVGKDAVNEIARRLVGSPFSVIRKEASLVFARYGSLELDIIPDVGHHVVHDKWKAQVDHLKYFQKMDPALKHVVRLVKAWARLFIPVPGIVIETVVDEVGRSESTMRGSLLQKVFIATLQQLSFKRRWIDPCNPDNDVASALQEPEWDNLNSYAKSTLLLMDVVAVGVDGCAFMTFPSRHDGVKVLFDPMSHHSPIELGMLDGFEIVELCTRLALRRPSFGSDVSFFDQYMKPKSLKACSRVQSECCGDIFFNSVAVGNTTRLFKEACCLLERQKIQLGLPESSADVKRTRQHLLWLYTQFEQNPEKTHGNHSLAFAYLASLDRIVNHIGQEIVQAWGWDPLLGLITTKHNIQVAPQELPRQQERGPQEPALNQDLACSSWLWCVVFLFLAVLLKALSN